MKLAVLWRALTGVAVYPAYTYRKFTVWHKWSIFGKVSSYGVGQGTLLPPKFRGESVVDALMHELERKKEYSVGIAHAFHNEELMATFLGDLQDLENAIAEYCKEKK